VRADLLESANKGLDVALSEVARKVLFYSLPVLASCLLHRLTPLISHDDNGCRVRFIRSDG
jgi:hypothetical protein